MKIIVTLLLAFTLVLSLSACSSSGTVPENTESPSQSTSSMIPVEYDTDDLNYSTNSSGLSRIYLEGNSISLDGKGAIIDGSMITIIAFGTYNIGGVLNNGQIRVNTQDTGTVKLILDGVDIACSASAPVYIINAEKTVITLADGTDNYVKDGTAYVLEDAESDEPNAAIFSNDDLTINGNGSLIVTAGYNNGIQSKDELKITGGNITVNAANDGIKGRDSIMVKGGNIIIKAGGDGMQSNNDEDAEKGIIGIERGVLNIIAGMDGIQAETGLLVSGGEITVSTGGGSINSSSAGSAGIWGRWGMSNTTAQSTAGSARGLKAGTDITITGGIINIDSSDDSVHSNGSITISGGNIIMASGDDGIHADGTIEINNGEIIITKSYEGIESSIITVNNGNIRIVSSDDGINVVGGVDGSALSGRPGQNTFTSSGNNYLHINGGNMVINAQGDGLDINGPIEMTGGFIIINGPTANDNGALDYSGGFKVTGGYMVAAGSSGMAQAPGTTSTQYSVIVNLSSQQLAGTLFHIETEDGKEILTFAPSKAYQSVVFCSSELQMGETYNIYTGGKSTGTATDGLYSGGKYSGGTRVTSLTVSTVVTGYGSSGGMFPGGGGGR